MPKDDVRAGSVTAAAFLARLRTLPSLRKAARTCQGCELFRRATQTVFGAGSPTASLMLVGETPGDQEDRVGKPFVGPTGAVLDRALAAAGLARSDVYVTNAVKHFKWKSRGKRRLHAKPSSRQINACRPWLEAEIEAVDPVGILCLGATAAQVLLGRAFRLTKHLGERLPWNGARWILATFHPSAVLRAPTSQDRQRMMRQFTSDLQQAAAALSHNAQGR